jgi:uncharacterized protein (TIGR00369 family)
MKHARRWIKQPNSRMCFGCGLDNLSGVGLHIYDDGAAEVVAEVTIGAEHQGFPGLAHGGVVAAILDEIGGRAAMIADHDRFVMTATMELKYRRPVPIGVPLRAVARLLRRRGRRATAIAELRDAGRLLAEARLLLTDIPRDLFRPTDLDRIGWRVYPEPTAARIDRPASKRGSSKPRGG